jgi:hypothetical protein
MYYALGYHGIVQDFNFSIYLKVLLGVLLQAKSFSDYADQV